MKLLSQVIGNALDGGAGWKFADQNVPQFRWPQESSTIRLQD